MAEKPYKINDRRGNNSPLYSGNNLLLRAATQSNDRKIIPVLEYDTDRNISRLGHRQLRSFGRYIFANFDMVHGALMEQAELSAATWIPQFIGKDQNWGALAEAKLMEWDRICDVRGWPYDGKSYRINLIVGTRRDGDHATLLTENADGYPMIQCIPVHRIGRSLGDYQVAGGPLDGAWIINGCIVNDFGATVAYRVYDEGIASTQWQDISANDMFLSFLPEYVDQTRGISCLASPALSFSDVFERRTFELLAQKFGSAINVIETNERGGPAPGAQFVTRPAAGSATAGTPTGLITESYDGGTVRYLKSGSGSKIEGFRNDRPSADSQRFEEAIVRSAFAGMEWPVDFSLDPSKCGGAQMRVVIEKVNSTIQKNQTLVEKAMRRIHGYAISKFIKLGILPPNDEWWKWTYQGPAQVTADAKYDSDIDLQEIRAGIGTRQRACAKRGEFWRDVDDQRESETDEMLGRAQRLAKKYNLQIQEIITLLNLPTPNGNLASVRIQEDNATDGEPGKKPSIQAPSPVNS